MITVNQTYKDLIELIQEALKSNQLNWQVIQSYQANMGNLRPPFIMLHRLTISNFGFQYGKDNGTVHTENQIEIQKYQIEAYKPRTAKDTAETISGTDVVRIIAMYFMSDAGLDAIRAKGYDVLRISEVAEEYYKDIGEVYQVNPHFTVDLVVHQTYSSPTGKISDFVGKVKEIEQLKNGG